MYYPNNQDCKWIIIAPNNYIRLKLQDFALEEGDVLTLDTYIKLTDNIISHFLTDKWLTLCQDKCEIKFTSDKDGTFRGFAIDVKFQKPPLGKCN